MNLTHLLTFGISLAATALATQAADKIGIAEPTVGSQFTKEDALAVWDELEASFKSNFTAC